KFAAVIGAWIASISRTMSPRSVCTSTRTGLSAAGWTIAAAASAAVATLVTIARLSGIATLDIDPDRWRSSEAIDRPELELAARVRPAGGLSEIDVPEDADVAVGGEILVVEQVEYVGAYFQTVLARQRERPRQGEVRVPDRRAARRIPSFGRGHV